MKSIKLTKELATEILVVGLAKSPTGLVIESGDAQIDSKKLLTLLADIGPTGNFDEITKISFSTPRTVYLTGLGDAQKKYPHEVIRRAAGAAARALAGQEKATFALPNSSSIDIAAIAQGAAFGAYAFNEFRESSKKDNKDPLEQALILTKFADEVDAKAVVKRAEILAKNIYLVRDLINTPPSHLTPDSFSQRMKKIATSLGLKVEILSDSVLKSKGYGGITAVGQGSANPPRLLRVSYEPAKATKRFAFVGKGITFDSGGLALKPAKGMER
jgi:leucyl aminopeptidase